MAIKFNPITGLFDVLPVVATAIPIATMPFPLPFGEIASGIATYRTIRDLLNAAPKNVLPQEIVISVSELQDFFKLYANYPAVSPTYIRLPSEKYILLSPEPVVDFNIQKNIERLLPVGNIQGTEADMQKQKAFGSHKIFVSSGDASVSIRGTIQNRRGELKDTAEYIRSLHQLYANNGYIEILNIKLLSLGVSRIVINDFSVQERNNGVIEEYSINGFSHFITQEDVNIDSTIFE